MEALRREHQALLAHYRKMKKKACPLTVYRALTHAEKYWYGAFKIVFSVDVMLYAVILLSLHLGLRLDEAQKIKMVYISDVSLYCTVFITELTKTQLRLENMFLDTVQEAPALEALH